MPNVAAQSRGSSRFNLIGTEVERRAQEMRQCTWVGTFVGAAGSVSSVESNTACGRAHRVRKFQETPTTSPKLSAWPFRPQTVFVKTTKALQDFVIAKFAPPPKLR